MGLDMYLKKGKRLPKIKKFESYLKIEEKVYDKDAETLEKYKDFVNECGQYSRWNSLFEEVGYWRKANQIHKWFVDNVQNGVDDCNYYEVTKEHIEQLLSICKEIRAKVDLVEGNIVISRSIQNGEWVNNYEKGLIISNPEVCEELLPTQSGFFFGSTDYDEYYMKDIDYTIELCERILKETDFENYRLAYCSSW